MKETDIAYIAGILDGEGYIGVKKTQPYKVQGRVTPGYHARIGVKMVSEEAIRFISETLGCWYWQEKRPQPSNGRPMFVLQATDKKAEEILRIVLPYLRVKREMAETVLALRELQREGMKHRTKITGHKNFPNRFGTERIVAVKSFSDEYVARCDAFWARCKELNAVGIRP